MTQENKKNVYLELLKYPVMVFSILFGLVGGSWMLGLDFSRITEVGPTGIRLAEVREDAALAVTDLEERLDDALARIQALEEQQGPGEAIIKPVYSTVSEPSDAVARLSRSVDETGTLLKGKSGYVWIGDYDVDTERWTQQNLLHVDDRTPFDKPVAAMARGSQYRIGVNTYMRVALPANDEEYFRGQKAAGVIPRGTLLTVIGEPVSIDREFAVQIWAEVEVAE